MHRTALQLLFIAWTSQMNSRRLSLDDFNLLWNIMGIRGMKAPVDCGMKAPVKSVVMVRGKWFGGKRPDEGRKVNEWFVVGHILPLNGAAAHHKWNFHLAKIIANHQRERHYLGAVINYRKETFSLIRRQLLMMCLINWSLLFASSQSKATLWRCISILNHLPVWYILVGHVPECESIINTSRMIAKRWAASYAVTCFIKPA